MPNEDQEQAGTSTLESADNEPDFIAHLKATGAPETVIENAQKGAMMQADYTRKCQDNAAFRNQLAAEQAQFQQQVAYAQGQASATGGGPKTKTQQFIAGLEQDENGKNIAPLFREFAESLQGDMVPQFQAQLQQSVGPIAQATTYDRIDKTLEQILKAELIPMYGKDVEQFWPQIKQGTLNLIGQGNIHATPQMVFQTYFAKQANTLFAVQEAAKKQKAGQQSMAGFDTVRRRTPVPNGNGNPQPNKRTDIGEWTEKWLANREKTRKPK